MPVTTILIKVLFVEDFGTAYYDPVVTEQQAAHGGDDADEILPDKHSRIHTRIDIFESIYTTLKSGYTMDNLYYVSSLLHYFLGSLRNVQQFRAVKKEVADERDRVQQSIHFMKENVENHLTLETLAQYVGYSVSHYSLLFKQVTGHSPLTYFNLLKVQEACFLLDTTDMQVNQISCKLGIADSYYFSRLFAKIMGMSPRAYQKKRKG